MPIRALTDRQREVLRFIVGFHDVTGRGPSAKEVATRFGITSRGAARILRGIAHRHLVRLDYAQDGLACGVPDVEVARAFAQEPPG